MRRMDVPDDDSAMQLVFLQKNEDTKNENENDQDDMDARLWWDDDDNERPPPLSYRRARQREWKRHQRQQRQHEQDHQKQKQRLSPREGLVLVSFVLLLIGSLPPLRRRPTRSSKRLPPTETTTTTTLLARNHSVPQDSRERDDRVGLRTPPTKKVLHPIRAMTVSSSRREVLTQHKRANSAVFRSTQWPMKKQKKKKKKKELSHSLPTRMHHFLFGPSHPELHTCACVRTNQPTNQHGVMMTRTTISGYSDSHSIVVVPEAEKALTQQGPGSRQLEGLPWSRFTNTRALVARALYSLVESREIDRSRVSFEEIRMNHRSWPTTPQTHYWPHQTAFEVHSF